MNLNPFHRHTYDPEKWKLVSKVQRVLTGLGIKVPEDMGIEYIYRNTCLKCGDLVFRRVKEIK